MPIFLYDKAQNQRLFEITPEQRDQLVDALEEESTRDRDYYIDESPHYAEIRKQYVAHMVKMFVLAGDTQEQAAKEAAAVMKIETALAKASLTRVQRRDPHSTYHMMSIAELSGLAPSIDWSNSCKRRAAGPSSWRWRERSTPRS